MGSSQAKSSVHTFIQPDFPSCYPGGTITGQLYISSGFSIQASKLSIRLTCTETTRWTSGSDSSTQSHGHSKITLQLLYPVWHFDGFISEGQYSIPFNLQLPQDLIPSFSISDPTYLGEITYTLDAVFIDNSKIEALKSIIWVHSNINPSKLNLPLIEQKSFNIRTCCLKSGISYVNAELFPPTAGIDEKLNLSVRVINNQGDIRVRRISCILYRRIRLIGEGESFKNSKVFSEEIYRAHSNIDMKSNSGISPKRFSVYPLVVRAEGVDMWKNPSLRGRLVECEYYVEVRIEFYTACGVKEYCLKLPAELCNGRIRVSTSFTTPPKVSNWCPVQLSATPVIIDSYDEIINEQCRGSYISIHSYTSSLNTSLEAKLFSNEG